MKVSDFKKITVEEAKILICMIKISKMEDYLSQRKIFIYAALNSSKYSQSTLREIKIKKGSKALNKMCSLYYVFQTR